MKPEHTTRSRRPSVGTAPRTASTSRPGFTLIELLASMAILMMIVSVLGIVFTESNRAWSRGTGQAESNTDGRAAVNAIAQDLQYALADDILTFRMRLDGINRSTSKPYHEKPAGVQYPWPVISYAVTNSELAFVALTGSATNATVSDGAQRSTRCIYYWVREATDNDNFDGKPTGRYELMRTEVRSWGKEGDTNFNRYPYLSIQKGFRGEWYDDYDRSAGQDRRGTGNRHDATGRGVIAGNIGSLRLYAAGPGGNLTTEYNSTDFANRLPEFVDVMLEVMSEEDARKAGDLELRYRASRAPTDRVSLTQFVERNAQRYTTRVYFHNRSGYRQR
ncbi:MAG: prepilin-type N-terminal cleavage/methylation domain-containing protein [Lentisphaerae bacterium]|nr:prepilin-type N-terminal cleavage/methylation domain-containing protein [Lentisphaerota bacterium]